MVRIKNNRLSLLENISCVFPSRKQLVSRSQQLFVYFHSLHVFFIILTSCSHQSRFRFIKRAHREIVQVYTLALLKVVHTHTVYSRSIQNVDIFLKLVFAATVYAMLEWIKRNSQNSYYLLYEMFNYFWLFIY